MIADIHGKISLSGSNLIDRLEDNLTGNFFGALRYIPFDIGLKTILAQGVFPASVAEIINSIHATNWHRQIKFWPYDPEGEIDVLIEFDTSIIGIEVKYLSGLSSDDDLVFDEELETDQQAGLDKRSKQESCNQLARESRIVARYGQSKTCLLLLVADGAQCHLVYEDVINRGILAKNTRLGYISWQTILEILQRMHFQNEFYQVVLEDLTALLIQKGFEKFKDMTCSITDIGEIAAGQSYNFGNLQTSAFKFNFNELIDGGLSYEFC